MSRGLDGSLGANCCSKFAPLDSGYLERQEHEGMTTAPDLNANLSAKCRYFNKGFFNKTPGHFKKNPRALLKDPPVLLKEPGVLLNGPGIL